MFRAIRQEVEALQKARGGEEEEERTEGEEGDETGKKDSQGWRQT